MSSATEKVLDLLRGYIKSAALGAALELKLFWTLDGQPRKSVNIAESFEMPVKRCQYWLELLRTMGYLNLTSEGYTPSQSTRETILKTYSKETWALLAQEARERLPAVGDLTINIRKHASTWVTQGLTPPDYVTKMKDNPERARKFTRMLYEIHKPLSKELASIIDMTGVKTLMDLGGGSGVMSFEFLKQNPNLKATVIDLENVCVAGREIAQEISLDDRIEYIPLDFVHCDLPKGFDMVLECDVGIYTEALFHKLKASLNPQGRIVIVDQLVREDSSQPRRKFQPGYAFLASLSNPDFSLTTVKEVTTQLTRVGFQILSESVASDDMTILQAKK